jgi:hypothetical protein
MFGIAATGGKIDRLAVRRLSTWTRDDWTRDYLCQVALTDLGCAVVGVFMAAQIRFGDGAGSDEFRKVLYAGVCLAAAIAIFSYAVNLQLSRGHVVIALLSMMLLDIAARYGFRNNSQIRRPQ